MISKEEIQELLLKNQKRISKEISLNRELVQLIGKSTTEKLSVEERDKVKYQLLEIFKSIPALAIFLLPGGMILLPLVAKLLPDIMPNAFKDESE